MRSWLVAFIGTIMCVVSLGLLSAPAGARGHAPSTTTVTNDATSVVTGGTFTFTATVTATPPLAPPGPRRERSPGRSQAQAP